MKFDHPNHDVLITKVTVVKKGEPIFHQSSIDIQIDDCGGGEYVAISQVPDDTEQKICIDPSEWPMVREIIDQMVERCRA